MFRVAAESRDGTGDPANKNLPGLGFRVTPRVHVPAWRKPYGQSIYCVCAWTLTKNGLNPECQRDLAFTLP